MKSRSNFGWVENPALVKVTSTSTACRFCEDKLRIDLKKRRDAGEEITRDNYYKELHAARIKRGTMAFRLVVHTGPTGRVYICKKHVKMLAKSFADPDKLPESFK